MTTDQERRITAESYCAIRDSVQAAGFGHEREWSQNIGPCSDPVEFALEACFVILNSGMRAQVCDGLWKKIKPLMLAIGDPSSVFGHKAKCRAMSTIWTQRRELLKSYRNIVPAELRVEFLQTLPWIGPITKYHLARNLGEDVCKPDRHLERIAASGGETPLQMCSRLARETGDRIGTVDVVIWRAANLGIVWIEHVVH